MAYHPRSTERKNERVGGNGARSTTRKKPLTAFLAANPFKPMEKPQGFISADVFARAIWQSLDAAPADHAHGHGH